MTEQESEFGHIGEIVARDHIYVCGDCGQNINTPRCSARAEGQPNPVTFTSLLNDPTQQLDPESVVLRSISTPPEPSGGGPTCACVGYTTRTDYGTGIEYDVDRSSCPIHSGLTEEELGDA